ncbi:MAG: hypothetical protein IH898_12645, partial [Planctomycetes bacterium]|nr:hypothetical protein [Planctomycetota bacterium]
MMDACNRNTQEGGRNLSCVVAASAVAQLSGYLLFAGLLCGFAWSCPARAGSIVASAAPNGALLDADGIVAFEGATVTDSINFLADPET